jgi:hypothetical protein
VQFESWQKKQIFLFLQNVQTSAGAHPNSYSVGIRYSSPGGEVDGALGCPFIRLLRKHKLRISEAIPLLPTYALVVCPESQINSVHALLSYFFKIHFNIILANKTRSSKWSLFLRFLHQNPVCASPSLECATCFKNA